jgi:hypothetical protein
MNAPVQPSLMLHRGARLVDFLELDAMPLPEALGPRHQPFAYGEYVTQVKDCMSNYGLEVVSEQYALSPDNNKMFGIMQLQSTNTTYAPIVGLRGSHDQSLSRGLAVGSKVFCCDNLAFSGDQVIQTKQTKFIARRLPRLIDKSVGNLPALFTLQDDFYQLLQRTDLTDFQADRLITEVVRREIVPSSKSRELIREWDAPSFDHGDKTLWRMLNSITQVLKPDEKTTASGYAMLKSRTIKAMNLFEEALTA